MELSALPSGKTGGCISVADLRFQVQKYENIFSNQKKNAIFALSISI